MTPEVAKPLALIIAVETNTHLKLDLDRHLGTPMTTLAPVEVDLVGRAPKWR